MWIKPNSIWPSSRSSSVHSSAKTKPNKKTPSSLLLEGFVFELMPLAGASSVTQVRICMDDSSILSGPVGQSGKGSHIPEGAPGVRRPERVTARTGGAAVGLVYTRKLRPPPLV